jgi:hypothetical protein
VARYKGDAIPVGANSETWGTVSVWSDQSLPGVLTETQRNPWGHEIESARILRRSEAGTTVPSVNCVSPLMSLSTLIRLTDQKIMSKPALENRW